MVSWPGLPHYARTISWCIFPEEVLTMKPFRSVLTLAVALTVLVLVAPAGEPQPAVRILEGHTGSVLGVEFSPDGKTLMSCSRDKTIKIWNVPTGKLLRTLTEHDGDVY